MQNFYFNFFLSDYSSEKILNIIKLRMSQHQTYDPQQIWVKIYKWGTFIDASYVFFLNEIIEYVSWIRNMCDFEKKIVFEL